MSYFRKPPNDMVFTLPRIAIRGRPFLSEHANDNWFCYYKGGLRLRLRSWQLG
jgi:hypothetical protein